MWFFFGVSTSVGLDVELRLDGSKQRGKDVRVIV